MQRFCFVVPVYRHSSTLAAVLDALRPHGLPIIVVDDGNSLAEHQVIVEACEAFNKAVSLTSQDIHSPNGIDTKLHQNTCFVNQNSTCHTSELNVSQLKAHLVSYPLNQGKGFAIAQSLAFAANCGYTHAIQIDADLQHAFEDINTFIESSQQFPDRVISGHPVYDESAPKSRVMGRKITNFWVAIETLSLSLLDCMCGFRIYPVDSTLACLKEEGFKRRMEFDIEVLVKLYRRGVKINFIDTKVKYFEGGISNFRMLKDNLAISWMHTSLVLTMPFHLKGILSHWKKHKDTDLSEHCDSDQKVTQWEKKDEKNGLIGMEILLFIRKYLGATVFKLALFIVVFCFWCADKQARRSSKEWFNAVNAYRLKRSMPVFENVSSLHHFYSFAQAMYDKIAVWHNEIVLNENAILADEQTKEIVQSIKERNSGGKGAVVLCCHVGNMEVCRALAKKEGTGVTALMHTANAKRFKQIMDKYTNADDLKLVEVQSIDAYTAMELDDEINKGNFVAIAADRVAVNNHSSVYTVKFMDRYASIPKGPFVLASLLKCDVYLLFSAKADGVIKIYLERFTIPKVARAKREEMFKDLAQEYASKLETFAAKYPDQWFNFYDYFTDNPCKE